MNEKTRRREAPGFLCLEVSPNSAIYPPGRLILFGKHADFVIAELHQLASTHLVRLAQLDLAIDGNLAVGDVALPFATTVSKTGKLEQEVQLDVIAFEAEFMKRHMQRWLYGKGDAIRAQFGRRC